MQRHELEDSVLVEGAVKGRIIMEVQMSGRSLLPAGHGPHQSKGVLRWLPRSQRSSPTLPPVFLLVASASLSKQRRILMKIRQLRNNFLLAFAVPPCIVLHETIDDFVAVGILVVHEVDELPVEMSGFFLAEQLHHRTGHLHVEVGGQQGEQQFGQLQPFDGGVAFDHFLEIEICQYFILDIEKVTGAGDVDHSSQALVDVHDAFHLENEVLPVRGQQSRQLVDLHLPQTHEHEVRHLILHAAQLQFQSCAGWVGDLSDEAVEDAGTEAERLIGAKEDVVGGGEVGRLDEQGSGGEGDALGGLVGEIALEVHKSQTAQSARQVRLQPWQQGCSLKLIHLYVPAAKFDQRALQLKGNPALPHCGFPSLHLLRLGHRRHLVGLPRAQELEILRKFVPKTALPCLLLHQLQAHPTFIAQHHHQKSRNWQHWHGGGEGGRGRVRWDG